VSWLKGQIVEAAFEELALAGYTFDITPDETTTALRKLEAMMAMWGATKGIRIGYNADSDPDPDQDSGVPDWALEGVFLNLSIRLAAGFGKPVPATTAATAKDAFDGILSLCSSRIPEMQFAGNLPAGSGWKPYGGYPRPFIKTPVDRLTTGEDGLLDLNGPAAV
jgi:hypothetical protein